MRASYFMLAASVLLPVAPGSRALAQTARQNHIRYAIDRIDANMTTRPDGTPVLPNEMFVQVDGLPQDARLYCNGTYLGRGRTARLSARPDEPVNCDFQILQNDGLVSYTSLTLRSAGRRYIFKMRQLPRKYIVITSIECIRQDKWGFDWPQLNIYSNLFISDTIGSKLKLGLLQHKGLQPIASNTTHRLDYSAPIENIVNLDLYADLISADYLGRVTVRLGDKARDGVFDLDPRGRGSRYRITWRIEPDDSVKDDLRKEFRVAENKKDYLDGLRNRAQHAADQTNAEDKTAKVFDGQFNTYTTSRGVASDYAVALRDGKSAQGNYNSSCTDMSDQQSDLNTKWSEAKFAPLAFPAKPVAYNSFRAFAPALVRRTTFSGVLDGFDWPPKRPHLPTSPSDIFNKFKQGVSSISDVYGQLKQQNNPVNPADFTKDMIDQLKTVAQRVEDVAQRGKEQAAISALDKWRLACDQVDRYAGALKMAIQKVNELAGRFAAISRGIADPQQVIDLSNRGAAVAKQGAAWARERRDVAAKEAAKIGDQLRNQELIVYHIENDLSFSLNAHTGAYQASIDLGFAGLEWDTEKTKALFAGHLTLPEVDPLQLAAASYGLKISEAEFDKNFDSVEETSASSGTHMYVASRRFVHWGGPATAARLVEASIFDGGNQAREEARQELTLELDRLYAWVASNLQGDVSQTLREVFASALGAVDGRGAQLPSFPAISASPLTVTSSYKVESTGSSYLPESVQKVILDRFRDVVSSVSKGRVSGNAGQISHYGFTITWGSRDEAADRQVLSRLQEWLFQGVQSSQAAFPSVISYALDEGRVAEPMRSLVSGLTSQDLAMRQADGDILDTLRRRLNLNDIAEWYVPGQSIIHLEGTPIGRAFASLFGEVAIGNNRRAELTRIVFDLETMTFSGRLKVIHEQSWGTLDSLLNVR